MSSQCPVCDKSVYQAEQLVACKKTWHKPCFCCGATVGNGCSRKLDLSNYQNREGIPYCSVCFDRLAKQASAGVKDLDTVREASQIPAASVPEPEVAQLSLADRARAFQSKPADPNVESTPVGEKKIRSFKSPSTTAPLTKCPVCEKSVYQAEQIVACTKTWHKTCFCCGSTAGNGCNRKLDLSTYQNREGVPYCRVCFDRLAKQASAGVKDLDAVRETTQAAAPTPEPEEAGPLSLADRARAFQSKPADSSTASTPVERKGRPSFKPSPAAGAPSTKCPVCEKSVYQAEQLVACNKTWHKTCFCCGSTVGNGCNRKLDLSTYQHREGVPYCSVCFDRLAKQASAGVKVVPVAEFSGSQSAREETGPQRSLSELKANFSGGGSGSAAVKQPSTKQTAAPTVPAVSEEASSVDDEGPSSWKDVPAQREEVADEPAAVHVEEPAVESEPVVAAEKDTIAHEQPAEPIEPASHHTHTEPDAHITVIEEHTEPHVQHTATEISEPMTEGIENGLGHAEVAKEVHIESASVAGPATRGEESKEAVAGTTE